MYIIYVSVIEIEDKSVNEKKRRKNFTLCCIMRLLLAYLAWYIIFYVRKSLRLFIIYMFMCVELSFLLEFMKLFFWWMRKKYYILLLSLFLFINILKAQQRKTNWNNWMIFYILSMLWPTKSGQICFFFYYFCDESLKAF